MFVIGTDVAEVLDRFASDIRSPPIILLGSAGFVFEVHLVSDQIHLVFDQIHLVRDQVHLIRDQIHLVRGQIHLVFDRLHLVFDRTEQAETAHILIHGSNSAPAKMAQTGRPLTHLPPPQNRLSFVFNHLAGYGLVAARLL